MSAGGRKTILLVEDELLIAVSEKRILEKYGYAVLTADTAEAAVMVFSETGGIDLILMDIDLGPGMDGPSAALSILEIREVPVVFLSSHSESEVVEKTEKITSYGYVVKSSSPAVLNASIKMAFRLFDANRQLAEKEALFQSFFNSAVVGTAINSPDGAWLYVNDTLCSMLGYTREELEKLSWKDLTPPEDLQAELVKYRVVEAGKTPSSFEKKYIRKDGTLIDISVSTSVIRNQDGTPAHFSTIFTDISERNATEARIRENENKYRTLMDLSVNGIVLGSHEGIITDVNEYMCDLVAMSRSELVGRHVSLLPFTRESLERAPLRFDLLHQGETVASERTLLRPDGTEVLIEMRTRMMPDGTYQSSYIDVTEAKKAERVLVESEEKFRTLADSVPFAIMIYQNEHWVYTNRAGELMSGYTAAELYTMHFWDFTDPSDVERIKSIGFARLNGEAPPSEYEFGIIPKQGGQKRVFLIGRQIEFEGRPAGLITVTDITERKLAEGKISDLLSEKNLILKEVHHRIKNNLSTISSLLALHADSVEHPDARAALEDAEARIQSMTILYQKLYQAAEFDEMSAKEYLPSLIDEIMRNFPNSELVTVERDIGDFTLAVKKMQPLGIIINELLTNIMKYAFPETGGGHIAVRASIKGTRVTVEVEDDGIGIPASAVQAESRSFGLMLVAGLTKQLKGTMTVSGEKGTRNILEFDQ